MKNNRKDYLILLALVLVLLVFGILIGRRYWLNNQTGPAVTTVTEEPRHFREVRLYFGGQDAMYLMAETRVLENCVDDQVCLQQTVQALIDGPVGSLAPIMSPRTLVRSVSEQGGVATIDFSRELVDGHPGGSASELFTVYGLANTLAENFPYIRQVRILIEGQSVESLKGHVDLTGPITADFRYVRQQLPQSKSAEDSAREAAEAASAADRSQFSLPAEEELSGEEIVPQEEEPIDLPEEGFPYDDSLPIEEDTP